MRLRLLPLAASILALTGCTADTTPTARATPPTSPALTDRIDAIRGDLDELVHAGAVGALATLADNGRSEVVTAGVADTVSGQPIPTDPPQYVRVGSLSKSFVAAIVLQLVDDGHIAFDEPVDTYLPGVLSGDGIDGREITVRQLLRHRSGIPELTLDPEMDEARAARTGRTFTPAEEIAIALRRPAEFAPDSRFQYSNTNYIVAGMLVERVTGHHFADELQARILDPLGLRDTYLPTAGEVELRAPHPLGYATADGRLVEASRIEPSVPWVAGALVSTGADINRFYLALASGQVVPPTVLSQLRDGSPMGDGTSYGLGVMYSQLPCGAEYIGHNGGIHGFLAVSGATPDGRAVTVSLTGPVPQTAVDPQRLLEHALCP